MKSQALLLLFLQLVGADPLHGDPQQCSVCAQSSDRLDLLCGLVCVLLPTGLGELEEEEVLSCLLICSSETPDCIQVCRSIFILKNSDSAPSAQDGCHCERLTGLCLVS